MRNIKDDGRLLPIRSCTVDLCRRFAVCVKEIQGNGGSKLLLPVLPPDLDVGCPELALSIVLHNSKEIPDDLFLPG